jgi:hypothetical protein
LARSEAGNPSDSGIAAPAAATSNALGTGTARSDLRWRSNGSNSPLETRYPVSAGGARFHRVLGNDEHASGLIVAREGSSLFSSVSFFRMDMFMENSNNASLSIQHMELSLLLLRAEDNLAINGRTLLHLLKF